jgi:cytochrome c6
MKMSQRVFVTLMCIAAPVAFAATAQENWTAHCAKCHGADGTGETTMGKKLKLLNYTTAEGQAAFTDEKAVDSIANGAVEDGKTKKKGFKDKLSADEIADLVKHVRAFGPK